MASGQAFQVQGYELAADRLYHEASHFWVEPVGPERARIGLDPLGRETSGDVIVVSFEPLGTTVAAGAPFGHIEAAKFVGPLSSPVSGTIVDHNADVLGSPGLLNEDPMRNWLVELELDGTAQLEALLSGEQQVSEWFAAEIKRFRTQGAIAE